VSSEKAPAHLSPTSKRWYLNITESYQLDSHHLLILQLAAEAFDRVQQARVILESEGIILTTKSGTKPHPAVMVERDNRLAFARLVAQLQLDEADHATLNGQTDWRNYGEKNVKSHSA
jgi:phage terminase small subunit